MLGVWEVADQAVLRIFLVSKEKVRMRNQKTEIKVQVELLPVVEVVVHSRFPEVLQAAEAAARGMTMGGMVQAVAVQGIPRDPMLSEILRSVHLYPLS